MSMCWKVLQSLVNRRTLGFSVKMAVLASILIGCTEEAQNSGQSSSSQSTSSAQQETPQTESALRYQQTLLNSTGEYLRIDWDESENRYTSVISPDGAFMFNAGELLLPNEAAQSPASNAQLALREAIPPKKFALSARIGDEFVFLGYLEDFLDEDMRHQQKNPALYHQRYSLSDDALSAAQADIETIAQPSRNLAEPLDVLVTEHHRIFVAGEEQFRLAYEHGGAIIEQFSIGSGESTSLPVATWGLNANDEEDFFTEFSHLHSEQRIDYLESLQSGEMSGTYNLYIYRDDEWQFFGNLEEVAEHSVSNLHGGILLDENGEYGWDILHSYHVRSDAVQRFIAGDDQQPENDTTLDDRIAQWQSRDMQNYSYFFALNNHFPLNSGNNVAAKIRVESEVPVDATSLFPEYPIAPDSALIETIDQSFERIRRVWSLSEEENFEGRKIGTKFDYQLNYPLYIYETFERRTDSNTNTYYHVVTGTSDAEKIQEYYDRWSGLDATHYSMDYTANSGNEYYVEVLDNTIIHLRRYQANSSFSALAHEVMTIEQVYQSAVDWALQDEGVMMDFTVGDEGVPESLFWLTIDVQPHFRTGKVQIRNFQILD